MSKRKVDPELWNIMEDIKKDKDQKKTTAPKKESSGDKDFDAAILRFISKQSKPQK